MSSIIKLTGSGFARAEKCPPSTFLPGVDEPPSVYAKLGSAVHRYLCLVAELGGDADAALEHMEVEFRSVCGALDLDQLPHSTPDAWAFEVAFAWDSVDDTARELYRGSGAREYGELGPTEIPGTADLVGVDGDCVIVLDLKVGWKPLPPPETALQLLFYAVAAARAYGCTRAKVGWVRLNGDSPLYVMAELDTFDLEAAVERLRDVCDEAMFAEVDYRATGNLDLVSGDHCQHCRAFLRCPAKATLLRELAIQSLAKEGDPTALTPVLDAETVPQVLERLWAVQEVLKRVKETVEEYASTNPVQMPDGKVYGAVEKSEETLDPEVGARVIADLYGQGIAEKCIETKTVLTKSALERELKPLVKDKGEKWAPTERALLKAIREQGGSRVSTWTTVTTFRPK